MNKRDIRNLVNNAVQYVESSIRDLELDDANDVINGILDELEDLQLELGEDEGEENEDEVEEYDDEDEEDD